MEIESKWLDTFRERFNKEYEDWVKLKNKGKYSQKAFAEYIGLANKNVVQRYLSNSNQTIQPDDLCLISKKLNVSTDYLLGFKNIKSYEETENEKAILKVSKLTGIKTESLFRFAELKALEDSNLTFYTDGFDLYLNTLNKEKANRDFDTNYKEFCKTKLNNLSKQLNNLVKTYELYSTNSYEDALKILNKAMCSKGLLEILITISKLTYFIEITNKIDTNKEKSIYELITWVGEETESEFSLDLAKEEVIDSLLSRISKLIRNEIENYEEIHGLDLNTINCFNKSINKLMDEIKKEVNIDSITKDKASPLYYNFKLNEDLEKNIIEKANKKE